MDTFISLTLSASGYDGTVVSWEIVEVPMFGELLGTAPNIFYTSLASAVGWHICICLQVSNDVAVYLTFSSTNPTRLNSVYITHQLRKHNNRVLDDLGELSNVASMMLKVRNCDLIDIFQVPSTYPVFSGSFYYVHVSEDGTNLDNMETPAHSMQWQNPGFCQFSLQFEVEPYYNDLLSCMTSQALSGSSASFPLWMWHWWA